MPVFKIGMIGFGYWGPVLLRNFAAHSCFDPVMLCDRNDFKAQKAKKICPSIQIVKNHNKLIENNELKAIVIATQASTHYDLAMSALQSGKDVFVEKPLAVTFEESQNLIDFAESSDRKIWVDHTFLFTDAYKEAKRMLNQGVIGKVNRIFMARCDYGIHQKDVNICHHLFYHDAYILYDLFNESKISFINAVGDDCLIKGMFDMLNVHIRFDNSTTATVYNDLCYPEKRREVVFYGAKGCLIWDETRKSPLVHVPIKANLNGIDGSISYSKKDSVPIRIQRNEALQSELDAFASYLSGSYGKCSGKNALKVIRLVQDVNDILMKRMI